MKLRVAKKVIVGRSQRRATRIAAVARWRRYLLQIARSRKRPCARCGHARYHHCDCQPACLCLDADCLCEGFAR